MLRRRGALQQKKKLFDPEAGDDVWKHDRFGLLDLPPEVDDYRVNLLMPTPCVRSLLPASLELPPFWQGVILGFSSTGARQGFLASGRRGGGRRGGRGSRGTGRPGVNPPPGYENGYAAGPAADSSAQYDNEEGSYARGPGYAEQTDGRGRGRSSRGRGRARSAVPFNGQQAGDGYGVEVCTPAAGLHASSQCL